MKIKTFQGGYDKNLSYLIYCEETKMAAVIDPAVASTPIFECIERLDLILTKILITHTHHDHYQYLSDYYSLKDEQYEMQSDLRKQLEEDFMGNLGSWLQYSS